MTYNTTFMDNSNNMLDLISGLSTAFGNDFILGNLILLSSFVVILVLGYKQGLLETLVVGGFINTVIAILLYGAGLIAAQTIAYPFLILMIAILFYFFS